MKRLFDASGMVRVAAIAVLGSILLCWVAIVNGYPLVFGDTGGYLRAGLELRYTQDRSPIYGLVILPLVVLGGLWAVVALQSLFAVLSIGAVMATVAGRLRLGEVALAIALLALSSLPWFTGMVMADVATGFVVIFGFMLLAWPRATALWVRCLGAAILSLLIALHLSHILLAASLLVIAAIAMAIRRVPIRGILGRSWPVGGAILLAALVLSAINLAAVGKFAPSVSTDTFLLARLLDGRLAQPVLERHCRRERLFLCSELPIVTDPAAAKPGQDFLWKKGSRVWTLVEYNRDAMGREQRMLIRETIADDPAAALRLTLGGWGQQLVKVRNGQIGRYPPEYSTYQQIAKHLPAELAAMRGSLQQRGQLDRIWTGWDVPLVLALMAIAPFLIWWALRSGLPLVAGFGVAALSTTIINAAVTGALSGPDDRYQGRVAWLLPLFAIMALLEYRRRRTLARHRQSD